MSEPFLSEIKIVSFNFPPKGWALCNGQLLPINQNQALFALLGTTYGGNGQTNFALPNLRGQVPIHRTSARRRSPPAVCLPQRQTSIARPTARPRFRLKRCRTSVAVSRTTT